MQPGELRHRVTLQRKSAAQDAHGEPIDEWQDVWTQVPARIRDLSGREFFAAQQVQADVTTEIMIRWREGVDQILRVVHQDDAQAASSPPEFTVYDILAVTDDTTLRRWIRLMCMKRTNRGFRAGDETVPP